MALSDICYADRARAAGLNVYKVCEADADGNIRTETVTPSNPTFNAYSIAKAYTVLAFGICRDMGLIDTGTHITDVLGKYMTEEMKATWSGVTMHHLMKHRAGYGPGQNLDIDASDAADWPSRDYLKLALDVKLPFAPGEEYHYTDTVFYLLSRSISEVSGMTAADLLRPALFDVMDYSEFAWSVCPRGYTMGGTGLYLRTNDLVKLAVLWLRGGDWFGTRIVSEDWVNMTVEQSYEFSKKSEDGRWIGKGGMRGQMLTLCPDLSRAVAWNSYQSKVGFSDMIKE